MRQLLLTFFLALFLVTCGFLPARAQDNDDAATYRITDVGVDVTADSAAHARDQAILQAQRTAFDELTARLGIEGKAPKPDDDALAGLVQAFEVQDEHISALRYIGTMTVQFKPAATRAYLGKSGSAFSEIRSRPLVILPLVNKDGRAILWEEGTPWHAAWDDAQKQTGLVPLVVPAGDLDDIAVIGAADALAGKTEALQALMKKYQAGGAVVATLNLPQDPPDPKQALRVDVTRYDGAGKGGDPVHFTLPPIGDKGSADAKAYAAVLADGVRQVRSEIEKNWRQASKNLKGPAEHLPVLVPIDSLAQWNAIKTKLGSVFGVTRVNVIALARDAAHIELEFHGDVPSLQSALTDQSLTLEQTPNGWVLRPKAE
jgi:hypothetical protein